MRDRLHLCRPRADQRNSGRGQHGGGKRYGSQHSSCVESTFAQFPGIKVVVPSTPYDAKGLLISAIRDENPVLFLEHKMLYFTRGDVPEPEQEYTVPIGKADVKRAGKDLTLVTFSFCLLQALEAAEKLRITHLIERKTAKLSGGEMQRVSIGRAIVRSPVSYTHLTLPTSDLV